MLVIKYIIVYNYGYIFNFIDTTMVVKNRKPKDEQFCKAVHNYKINVTLIP